MALTSMKRTKAEVKKDMPDSIGTSEEEYPYGLRLTFNTEEIAKLGISMPEVGTEVSIVAVATVASVLEREYEGEGEKVQNFDLQITDLALDAEGMTPSKADKFYGADK